MHTGADGRSQGAAWTARSGLGHQTQSDQFELRLSRMLNARMTRVSDRRLQHRLSELWQSRPLGHVLEIVNQQIDLAIADLVRRKARHLLPRPSTNRFRVANQRA